MATYLIYKPFGMLTQFSRESESQQTLADLAYTFEPDVYPIGRLDKDSEGLLMLSNDKRLNTKLLNPANKSPKTYYAQVEGAVIDHHLDGFRKGIQINIKGKTHDCLPCKAEVLKKTPKLPERYPPIRYRKAIPDTWVSITIVEGKNRQVRKMFAKIGFPVLRLVRVSFADHHLFRGRILMSKSGEVHKIK